MTSTGTSFLPGNVGVRLVGGPTALIEMGGLRFLTDPTFDPPGDHPVGNRVLVKTRGPAVAADDIGPVDAVLLSHDQHPDNLDDAGRRLLDIVPVVLTTDSAAGRLGGTTKVLAPWRHVRLPRPAGGELRVTGVPAQHGPDGTEDRHRRGHRLRAARRGAADGVRQRRQRLAGCRACGSRSPRADRCRGAIRRRGPDPAARRLPHPDQRPGRAGGADPGCPRRHPGPHRRLDSTSPRARRPSPRPSPATAPPGSCACWRRARARRPRRISPGLERLGELPGHEQQHRPGRAVLLDRHRPAVEPGAGQAVAAGREPGVAAEQRHQRDHHEGVHGQEQRVLHVAAGQDRTAFGAASSARRPPARCRGAPA